MGLITGIPVTTHVYDRSMRMAEINFLCVHKKLRAKRLAPVLIREVTRRVNRTDIWQATYTAGVKLPGNVGECRYYHRSINPQKLIEVGFSHLRNKVTMSMTKKLYALPDVCSNRLFTQIICSKYANNSDFLPIDSQDCWYP